MTMRVRLITLLLMLWSVGAATDVKKEGHESSGGSDGRSRQQQQQQQQPRKAATTHTVKHEVDADAVDTSGYTLHLRRGTSTTSTTSRRRRKCFKHSHSDNRNSRGAPKHGKRRKGGYNSNSNSNASKQHPNKKHSKIYEPLSEEMKKRIADFAKQQSVVLLFDRSHGDGNSNSNNDSTIEGLLLSLNQTNATTTTDTFEASGNSKETSAVWSSSDSRHRQVNTKRKQKPDNNDYEPDSLVPEEKQKLEYTNKQTTTPPQQQNSFVHPNRRRKDSDRVTQSVSASITSMVDPSDAKSSSTHDDHHASQAQVMLPTTATSTAAASHWDNIDLQDETYQEYLERNGLVQRRQRKASIRSTSSSAKSAKHHRKSPISTYQKQPTIQKDATYHHQYSVHYEKDLAVSQHEEQLDRVKRKKAATRKKQRKITTITVPNESSSSQEGPFPNSILIPNVWQYAQPRGRPSKIIIVQ